MLALAALATRPRWRSGVRSHRRVARHLSAPRALPDLPQQLAVAAAAAASHPELDDITITTVAAVDWQVPLPNVGNGQPVLKNCLAYLDKLCKLKAIEK